MKFAKWVFRIAGIYGILAVALSGGVIGRTIALRQPAALQGITLGMFLLPASVIFDKLNQLDFMYEVVSTIEIQASADKVWQQVILQVKKLVWRQALGISLIFILIFIGACLLMP